MTPLLPPGAWPFEQTSFVGRQRELVESCQLLWRKPMVAVTGVAGVGGSRLALHAAVRLRDDFPDGVRLIEMSTLRDPDLAQHAGPSGGGG